MTGLTYKLYRLDAEGHIKAPPSIIEAATDAEALQQASAHDCDDEMELWCGDRLIGTFAPKSA